MLFGKNKKTLSWSALDLWSRDKEKYRRRYYEGIKEKDTFYALFGKEIHQQLETDTNLSHIPRFEISEMKIEIEISGIPILGYIDSFSPLKNEFLDFKTGIKKPDGSPRWTQVGVEKHKQLDFYSLCIKEKFGEVYPVCKLIWLETEWREETITRGGATILLSRKLALTGAHEVFQRRIFEYQRKNMRRWIIESAREIATDFAKYKKENGI